MDNDEFKALFEYCIASLEFRVTTDRDDNPYEVVVYFRGNYVNSIPLK